MHCSPNNSKENSAVEIACNEEKVVSDEEKYSYDNFKKIFSKVELPYTIYTDSLEDNYIYWHDGDVYDSLGCCKKESLIPKEMARRWIIQYLDTSSTIDIFMRINSGNIDRFYDDPEYWFTLEPLIKLELPTFDILFVLHYHQISAVNGGYTNLIALRYTKDGYLLRAQKIGQYGGHTSVDTDTESYWARITDITSMVVILKSLDHISITTNEIREHERPDKIPAVTTTKRGTIRKVISIE